METKKPKPSLAVVATEIAPLILRPRFAGAYLDRSLSFMSAARAADTKAIREGRTPAGPPWIVIRKSIFYRRTDLDAWVAANCTERGTVAFSDRGGGAS